MDLSHHLSDEARRRQASLIKALYTYTLDPEIKSLGGGLPAASMFPISRASFTVPVPPLSEHADNTMDEKMQVELYQVLGPNGETCTVDLSRAQQYAAGSGFNELITITEELIRACHDPPASAKHEVTLTLGNTDGVTKMMRTLLNPGDNVLFEDFVFPPPVEQARAQGCGLVPVQMDSEGIDAVALDHLLNNWQSELAGRKPRVLYTVTIGQNPSGTSASLQRLKALYAIAQKHDLIVLEDDPYYYLQLGAYQPKKPSPPSGRRRTNTITKNIGGPPLTEERETTSLRKFAQSLAPSMLSLDVDGRVVRFDSFSKIVFPGARLGWITLNSCFRERFERLNEVTTQMGNDKFPFV